MFSKTSRYKKLEDVVVADSDGKLSASKALRLTPDVTGKFLHTVEESDRLDHLAYKYYKQPQKWWRICAANPDYPFPPALLGKDVMAVEQFPIMIGNEESEPLWSDVLADLNGLVGVEYAQLAKEEAELVERVETMGPDTVTLTVPLYRYTITVLYNSMNLNTRQLIDRMTGLGLAVGLPETAGRVGKTIVIPPNTVV